MTNGVLEDFCGRTCASTAQRQGKLVSNVCYGLLTDQGLDQSNVGLNLVQCNLHTNTSPILVHIKGVQTCIPRSKTQIHVYCDDET